MLSHAEMFKNDRYVYVENLLTDDECDEAIDLLIKEHNDGLSFFDDMCDKSLSFGRGPLTSLQNKKQKLFEEILGLKLVATYNYSRIYKPGEILQKHCDRYACEISVTITLGHVGKIWPIYFLNRNDSSENMLYYLDQSYYTKNSLGDESFSPFMDTSNKLKFEIKKGAGVFYRGCELIHWRDEYVEGDEQAQVFFHYVNANGPYRDLNNRKQCYEFEEVK